MPVNINQLYVNNKVTISLPSQCRLRSRHSLFTADGAKPGRNGSEGVLPNIIDGIFDKMDLNLALGDYFASAQSMAVHSRDDPFLNLSFNRHGSQ